MLYLVSGALLGLASNEVASADRPTAIALVALGLFVIGVGAAWFRASRRLRRLLRRFGSFSNRGASWSLDRVADQLSHQQVELLRMRNLAIEAASEARQSARARVDFVARVSHEIRTPLTAILGYGELLGRDDLDPGTRRAYLRTVQTNGDHLLHVLNDTLDLAKLEAGKMDVHREPCDWVRLIADAVTLLTPTAEGAGLTLDAEFTGEVPRTIDTDPTRLRQIVLNLVGNAIKFTEQGGVRVRCSIESGSWERQFAVVEVIDTGPGLSTAQQEALFAPYQQSEARSLSAGTGLGLVISRDFARLLGGGIHIRSTPGEGTTFIVRVDAGDLRGIERRVIDSAMLVGEEAEARANAAIALEGRVLVIDDAPDLRGLVGRMLQDVGLVVTAADRGARAVEVVREANVSGGGFDVVLLDRNLVDTTGEELAGELRRAGHRGPIVGLTADASSETRERLIAGGCDEVFTKPFRREDLLSFLRAVLGSGVEPEPTRPRPDPMPTDADLNSLGPLESSYRDDPDMSVHIEIFLEWLPERIEGLERALEEGDLESLGTIAHNLKGTGTTVGYPQITEVAARLEELVASGAKSPDRLRVATRRLTQLCRRAQVAAS